MFKALLRVSNSLLRPLHGSRFSGQLAGPLCSGVVAGSGDVAADGVCTVLFVSWSWLADDEQDRQPARYAPAPPQGKTHQDRRGEDADEIGVKERMAEPGIEGRHQEPRSRVL